MVIKVLPLCANVDAEWCSIYEDVSYAGQLWAVRMSVTLSNTHKSLRPMCHFTSTKVRTTSKAKQIKSFQWLGEEGNKEAIWTCFSWNQWKYYRDSFHLYDLSGKSSYLFSSIGKSGWILLNHRLKKYSHDPHHQFTHLQLVTFRYLRISCCRSKNALTVNYLQTWIFTGMTQWMTKKCARHTGLSVRRLTLPRHRSLLSLSFITC